MMMKIKYLIKNNIQSILFDAKNWLLLAIVYLILAFLVDNLTSSYLLGTNTINEVLIGPLFGTINILLTLIFVVIISQNYSQNFKITNAHFYQLSKIKKLEIILAAYLSFMFLSMILILPLISIGSYFYLLGLNIMDEFIRRIIVLWFTHLFVTTFVILSLNKFKRMIFGIFGAFLSLTIFSLLYSLSDNIGNIIISQFVLKFSHLERLENLQMGIYRLQDLVYFFSFPIAFCLYLYLIEDFKNISKFLKMRKKLSLLFSLSCFFIILNFLIIKKDIIIDQSSQKVGSLQKNSINELRKINGPIELDIFSDIKNRRKISYLLQLFEREIPNLKLNYLNPDLRPDLIQKYQIKKIPTIVIKKQKVINLSDINEKNLVNKFLEVDNINEKKLFVMLTNSDKKNNLQNFILECQKRYINCQFIQGVDEIPGNVLDSQLLILVEQDFSPTLINGLDQIIVSKGNITLMLPPNFGNKFPNLASYLKNWGINYSDHFIIDQKFSINGSKGAIPVVSQPKMVDGSFYNGEIIFPFAASILLNQSNTKNEFIYHTLALSSDEKNSWAEKSLDEINTLPKLDKNDVEGPHVLNLKINNKYNEGQLTIYSSNSFLEDKYFGFSKNVDYFFENIKSTKNIIEQEVNVNFSGVFKNNFKGIEQWKLYGVYLIPLFIFGFYLRLRKLDVCEK